ncbi:MAG TPA: penicillin-insensitive murein endopeptidase [Polyangiaceae bacterium]|nr:penicillin-insensitive murein endopeptidase [Polyangiaceae bacterium]
MTRREKTGVLPLLGALLGLALLGLAAPALGEKGKGGALPARFYRAPFALMSLSVGAPDKGWQVRAKKLKPASSLKIKTNSKPNVYGHPSLVLMLQRSARDVSNAGKGAVMLVGDLSSENGGPLAGHVSHQSGRDADVGFYVVDQNGKSKLLDRFVTFRGDGTSTQEPNLRFDDWRNWLLVQSWVRDRRAGLSHIFVSRPLRQRLLAFAKKNASYAKYVDEASVLLKQPEDSAPHDDHFHVRVSCPSSQSEICRK